MSQQIPSLNVSLYKWPSPHETVGIEPTAPDSSFYLTSDDQSQNIPIKSKKYYVYVLIPSKKYFVPKWDQVQDSSIGNYDSNDFRNS